MTENMNRYDLIQILNKTCRMYVADASEKRTTENRIDR